MRDCRKISRDRRRNAGLGNVDSVNGRNKRTCKKLDSVAVLERAPQKNEEVMIVLKKVVQCQQMVYPSVHGLGWVRATLHAWRLTTMAKCAAFSDWWQFTATDKATKRTQLRTIICWLVLQVLLITRWSKNNGYVCCNCFGCE